MNSATKMYTALMDRNDSASRTEFRVGRTAGWSFTVAFVALLGDMRFT
jgi:hypothetical protein